MDHKKDPARVCMKPSGWPEADSQAWESALQQGDVLEPGGEGAHWSDCTRRNVAKGYGRFLTWLQGSGRLDPSAVPAERATQEHVAAYIADLRARNAGSTVLARIQELTHALRVMAPENDWSWLLRIQARLMHTAKPARDKRKRIVDIRALYAYGLTLMAKADSEDGGTPLKRATRYSDGLIIALLAARPLRRRNITAIEIGKHLVRRAGTYWLQFEGAEIKNGRPIEAPLPDELVSRLERYLTYYRPFLARRTGRWNRGRDTDAPTKALWISRDGSAMTGIAIYFRITKLTKARFGHVVSPHLFRDAAATSIAIEDPEHVLITREILGHRTLRTSERHYNHAQSLEALRRHQAHVLQLRKSTRTGKLTERGLPEARRQEPCAP